MTGWRDDALCLEADAELWFPEIGDSETARLAKRICLGCPARAACLEFALDQGEYIGIWGGTTPNERRDLRRQRRTGQVAS